MCRDAPRCAEICRDAPRRANVQTARSARNYRGACPPRCLPRHTLDGTRMAHALRVPLPAMTWAVTHAQELEMLGCAVVGGRGQRRCFGKEVSQALLQDRPSTLRHLSLRSCGLSADGCACPLPAVPPAIDHPLRFSVPSSVRHLRAASHLASCNLGSSRGCGSGARRCLALLRSATLQASGGGPRARLLSGGRGGRGGRGGGVP